MDLNSFPVMTGRQTACQLLDIINQILRFVVQHMINHLSKNNTISHDGFLKGFDLKEVF